MSYIGQAPSTIVSENTFDEFNFTATSNQTTFTGVDADGKTLVYNPGNLEVFLNGVRLEEADFTATNGTSVVLSTGATTGDVMSVKSFTVFEVSDTVSKSSGGAFGGNISVTGTVTATSYSGDGSSLSGISTDLVGDITPQLGGNLDLNSKNISGTGNIDVTGSVTASTTVNVGTGGGFYLKQDNSESTIRSESQPIILQTYSSAWQDRLTIKNDGNVGVGTTSPATQLHVADSATNAYSSTITKGSNHSGLTLVQNDGMTGVFFATGGSGSGSHWSAITGSRSNNSDWATQLNFYTHPSNTSNLNDANQRMIITGDGNVGIGTDNPGTKLHIKHGPGGSTTEAFRIADDAGYTNIQMLSGAGDGEIKIGAAGVLRGSYKAQFAGTATGHSFNIGTSGANAITIDSSQKVGIGTTSPQQLLHVSANNPGGKIRLEMGQAGVANGDVTGEIQFYHNDSSGAGVNADIKGICTNSVGAGALIFGTGTTSTTERMRIDSSGKTTFKYDGSGGAKFESTQWNIVDINSDSDDNGTNDDTILRFTNGSSNAVKGEIRFDESSNTFEFGHGDNQNHLVIKSGGNVGIGTDNPESNLEVSNGSERYRIAFGTGEVYLMARNASAYIEAEYIAEQHEFRGFGNDSGNLAWKINTSGYLIPGGNDNRNIGENGAAISNMYMAGGIHFTNGGHGNAHAVHSGGSNYLDAYERGTFTFTLIGDSNPGHVTPATGNTTLYGTGYYEKIGNLCYVSCAYDVSNYSNYVFFHFGNIPFTSYNNSNMYYDVSCGHLRGIQFRYGGSTRTTFTFNASVPSNSTQIDLRTTDPSTPFSGYFGVVNVGGGKYIRASGVYATA